MERPRLASLSGRNTIAQLQVVTGEGMASRWAISVAHREGIVEEATETPSSGTPGVGAADPGAGHCLGAPTPGQHSTGPMQGLWQRQSN